MTKMIKKKPAVTALVDADIILHRALSFTDDEFDGEPIVSTSQGESVFDSMLERWLKEASEYFTITDHILYLSKGHSFRKLIYEPYKANRKDITPHPSFSALKERIYGRSNVTFAAGIEADDLIGVEATSPENKDRVIMLSADKDFKTLPGVLIIPASHGKTKCSVFNTSVLEANYNWMRQTLTGDVIDNFPGLAGIGPAKANKILEGKKSLNDMWTAVQDAFIQKGKTRDDALLMARLARILRHGDYNPKTNEVFLWQE